MESQLPHLFMQVMRLIRERVPFGSDPKLLLPPEFMALKYFQDNPSASLSSFATFIHVRKPTATELTKRLLTRAFLKRVQSQKDRRVFELELTEKGTEVLRQAEEVFATYAGGVFSALNNEEQNQLFQLLSKLIDKKHA